MFYHRVKRIFDISFSLVSIFLLFIPLLFIVIAIKLDSKGPVVFSQTRIGKDKKEFQILKFRTMKIDTPQNIPTNSLVNRNKWITRVGRVLRKTSLDELPQIINVIKGDMSIIGPRPSLWNQYELINERDKFMVHSIYPGLTGYAQISGRDELTINEKVELDSYYVKNISLMLDIKIFFSTFLYILKSEGNMENKKKESNAKDNKWKKF